jgi:alpha-beta hydrolase superfamily lysophospholipase
VTSEGGSVARSFRWPARAIAIVASLTLIVSGCQDKTFTVDAPAPIVVPMPTVSPAVWDARGALISNDPMDVSEEIRSKAEESRRVTYRSVSGLTGAGTEVSGAFFTPKGQPPEGGWPVIGVAHGFTGANPNCGPSSTPDLRQYYGLVAALLATGFAVAFTDYEGLGPTGVHPFLEPRTAAFNVIDSVRVLRTLFPNTSTRWVAFGISQGGQASWAANELNGFYGGGLELVGATAIAPAANVAGLAQLAYHEALTAEQMFVMPSVVVGAERAFPSVPVDHLLRGAATQDGDAALGCSPAADQLRAKVTAADVKPDTEADAAALQVAMRKMSLPTSRLSVPLYVLNGSDDSLVLPNWVQTSVTRACELGGQIEHHVVAGAGHAIGPDQALTEWVTDRFAGKPAPTNCGAGG